jgi:hypothetical protein
VDEGQQLASGFNCASEWSIRTPCLCKNINKFFLYFYMYSPNLSASDTDLSVINTLLQTYSFIQPAVSADGW